MANYFPTGRKRLLKLAKHLMSGRLGHKEFHFAFWNYGPRNTKGCGTLGCAIGECPIVFPKEWEFYGGEPTLKKTFHGYAGGSASSFFGLTIG